MLDPPLASHWRTVSNAGLLEGQRLLLTAERVPVPSSSNVDPCASFFLLCEELLCIQWHQDVDSKLPAAVSAPVPSCLPSLLSLVLYFKHMLSQMPQEAHHQSWFSLYDGIARQMSPGTSFLVALRVPLSTVAYAYACPWLAR